MSCEHESFEANVAVNRMPAVEGGPIKHYSADVTIRCVQCGEPFRFIGLPAGVDFTSPTVSVDGCEGRFPILPKSESLSELEGTPIGFTVRKAK